MGDVQVSKDFGSETIEGISSAASAQQPGQQQLQIQIDDTGVESVYSKTANVWGSAEELFIDFCGPIRPTGPKSASMKVYSRVALSPFAAKRLKMMLEQALDGYEKTYGPLELDERKRRIAQPEAKA